MLFAAMLFNIIGKHRSEEISKLDHKLKDNSYVTVISGQRSFDKLKIIKSYLRNNMG